jgi:hypothetical protein
VVGRERGGVCRNGAPASAAQLPVRNSQSETERFPFRVAISLAAKIRNASEEQYPYETPRKATAIFQGWRIRGFWFFFLSARAVGKEQNERIDVT